MKKLHLISFNVPFPADYGGIIDVFYKIKALKERGLGIILHCFEYGREPSEVLNKYCLEVHYYQRYKGPLHLLDSLPYIVNTRTSQELETNLKKNNFPIIFEGLHTTSCIKQIGSNNRKLIVRTHNVEHDYYKGLMEAETDITRKMYYYSESVKLKRYEKILSQADGIAAISLSDKDYFSKKFNNVHYIPAFHQFKKVESIIGKGSYVLFHGNLSVPENKKAALYIINNIFRSCEYNLVVAGKEPDNELIKAAEGKDNISIIADPDNERMDELISNAHINLLITFQSTGIKLKLLSSLFRGRFCLVNIQMVENTGLESLCNIAESDDEFMIKLNELFGQVFTEHEINKRRAILESELSNVKNAEKLERMLF